MLFGRVEKQGKYRGWTIRRVAFDTHTRIFYCTDKVESFSARWKHKIKVLRVIAKATVSDIHYRSPRFDPRDLFSFRVEGSYRPVGDGPPPEYKQPEPAEGDRIIIRHRTKPTNDAKKADKKKVLRAHESSEDDVLVWYMRTETQEDFMQIYTTIRDVLIRDGLRPPQFWGLPKMDPRIQVPLAEPPLYLWYKFRAVKHSVFYACAHGHIAVKSAEKGSPFKLSTEPMYLTLFDSSVMVFRESGRVFSGIPITDITSVDYASTDVNVSIKDPSNRQRVCFVSFLSDNEAFPDILFLPTLEPFAEPTVRNVPAAQIERVVFAVQKLNPLINVLLSKAGHENVPNIEIQDARKVTQKCENEATTAPNGLFEIYARVIRESREGGIALPSEAATEKKGVKQIDDLIQQLPPPRRLETLAAQMGIQMKKALVDFPERYEYFASSATVADPRRHKHREKNPLLDFFTPTTSY